MTAARHSELIEAAQETREVDAYAMHLMYALAIYSLPQQLANTGLKITYSEQHRQLTAEAHGKTLRSHYDHVWMVAEGSPKRRLGGRIRFFAETLHGEPRPMVYAILFDAIGHARVDNSRFFGNTIRRDEPELREALRRIALAIINAIHENMDTVDATPDA